MHGSLPARQSSVPWGFELPGKARVWAPCPSPAREAQRERSRVSRCSIKEPNKKQVKKVIKRDLK